MSKSSKPSDEPKDAVSDAVDESLIDPAETAETSDTLGVAKKTKAEREAEKEEARREKERETLRRRTTPQPVKLDGGKDTQTVTLEPARIPAPTTRSTAAGSAFSARTVTGTGR